MTSEHSVDESASGGPDRDEPAGGAGSDAGNGSEGGPVRGTGRAVEAFDNGVVDVLERLLSTETRARIYAYLCQHPGRTSEEIGHGTGRYPSTVRETLAAMTEEGVLTREKRESGGAGNNPFEYTAIPPNALVRKLVGELQEDLNTLCNLDHHLAGRRPVDSKPVRIEVRDGRGES